MSTAIAILWLCRVHFLQSMIRPIQLKEASGSADIGEMLLIGICLRIRREAGELHLLPG